MLRVNGFYGHVRRNDLRSLAMFAGFMVAHQILAAVVLFLPLLFLDTLHSLLVPSNYLARYVPIVFAVGVALFVKRFLRHVASVRATVDFVDVDRRTDPRLVNIVENAAIAAGLPLPKVGLIESPALNAFACGLGASSAVVVVTRGLVDALDDDELAAVVAHEVAHIRNGDIRLMAAANVLMEGLLRLERRNILRTGGWKRGVLFVFLPLLGFLSGAGSFLSHVALTVARVSRLLISSSREFVADADAVRLTHDPAALISALRRIEGRSAVAGLAPQADAMMIDGAVEGPYATHPTIAERIAVLSRLSGVLAGEHGPRRDTRSAAQAMQSRSPWQPEAVPPASPARLLINRVNAGTKRKGFVMTPMVRRVFTVVIVLFLGLNVFAIVRFELRETRSGADASRAGTTERAFDANAGTFGTPARIASPGAELRAEANRLSSLKPQEARCFATEWYRVGDRGIRAVEPPDAARVQAHASDRSSGSSDIRMERYLGLRLRSIEDIDRAAPAALDRAYATYVRTRKSMLRVAHRFFGEPGLSLMREAYDSPRDHAIVASLHARRNADGTAWPVEAGLSEDIDLLVSAPQDFIPCVARAALERADASPRFEHIGLRTTQDDP